MAKYLTKEQGLPPSKIDANLRMFCNGSFVVNQIRAELSGNVAIDKDFEIDQKICRSPEMSLAPVGKITGVLKKGELEKERKANEIFTNLFIEVSNPEEPVDDEDLKMYFEPPLAQCKDNIFITRVPITKILGIAAEEKVLSIQSSLSLSPPRPLIVQNNATAPPQSAAIPIKEPHNEGENILIGIIDVGGFDFAHPDFRDDNGGTRFVRIWDQGGSQRKPPAKFNFGSEFTQEQLSEAIKNAPSIKVPAQHIEKQSQMVVGSHGTHVASIAAGKSGVCPKAAIAGVLIELAEGDEDRRKSFYDSSRISLAVDYLLELANDLGKDAVSINIQPWY